jgi:hypothetical protein
MNFAAITFFIIGAALITSSSFFLLPNKQRIPNIWTTIASILGLVAGLFFVFLGMRLI